MPGTDWLIHSWPAWNNGYVAKFTKGCDCFCTDCNYTTLLSADNAGYYSIVGKTSGSIEVIGKEEVFDTVLRFATVCYDYFVNDPEVDLRIWMQVYGGEPDLYVSENQNDTIPAFLN